MRRSGRSTSSVDCRRIAEAAWGDGIEARVEGDLAVGDDVAIEMLMDELARELPIDVEGVVYFASMGGDVRLTRLEEEGVLVFSCDDPGGLTGIDGERWAMFGDADGSTVIVTAGRGVKRYREGSAVAT